MEINQETTLPAPSTLTPPHESRMSMILNGAGNGSMVAGAPIAAFQLYQNVKHQRHASVKGAMVLGFAGVTGALIGAVYGAREANRIQEYRQQLTNEINELKQQVQGQGESIGNWTRRHEELHAAEAKNAPVLG